MRFLRKNGRFGANFLFLKQAPQAAFQGLNRFLFSPKNVIINIEEPAPNLCFTRILNFLREVLLREKGDNMEKLNFSIGRIINCGDYMVNPATIEAFFPKLYRKWPKGQFCEILITPSDFMEIDADFVWDEDEPYSGPAFIFEMFMSDAEEALYKILTDENRRILRSICRYFVVGIQIDFRKNEKCIFDRHTRHILAIDTSDFSLLASTGPTLHSGKSYRYQLSCEDIRSHFVKLGKNKVVLIGDYDLSFFRSGIAERSEYDNFKRIEAFQKLMEKGRPDTVLHIGATCWRPVGKQRAWNHMLKTNPTVKKIAGSFGDLNCSPDNLSESFTKKLELTAGNDVLNILIDYFKEPEPVFVENRSRLKLNLRRYNHFLPLNVDKINLIGISSTGIDFLNWAETQYSKFYQETFITTSSDFLTSETPPFADHLLVGWCHKPFDYPGIKKDVEDNLDEIYSCLDPKKTNIIISSSGDMYSWMIIMYLAMFANEDEIELCAFLIDPINSDHPAIQAQIEETLAYLDGYYIPYFQYSYLHFLKEYPKMPVLTGTDKIYRSILERIAKDPLKGIKRIKEERKLRTGSEV